MGEDSGESLGGERGRGKEEGEGLTFWGFFPPFAVSFLFSFPLSAYICLAVLSLHVLVCYCRLHGLVYFE